MKSIFKGHPIGSLSEALNENLQDTRESLNFSSYKTKLSEIGVTDWEQFYSLLINEQLKPILKEFLQVENLENVIEIIKAHIPKERISDLTIEIPDLPFGAKKPIVPIVLTETFVPHTQNAFNEAYEGIKKLDEVLRYEQIGGFQWASSVNHISSLPPVKSQGNRGTCTAFAAAAINEFAYYIRTNIYPDLSEQYLFYESKLKENDENCSAHLETAMNIIKDKGVCPEGVWSYNPNMPCIQPSGKPTNADGAAFGFSSSYLAINPKDAAALRHVLASGKLVAISVPIFKSWRDSSETYRTGRITMPLPGEDLIAGHAMTLVGYQDDVTSPGEGYFLVRNSWGIDWAKDNIYGAGYGILPYAYITQHGWEAYTI